jgi:hypothetical protein
MQATNSKEQIPSWETDSQPAGQKITHILWNLRDPKSLHHVIHKGSTVFKWIFMKKKNCDNLHRFKHCSMAGLYVNGV